MSETMAVMLPVKAEFWQALASHNQEEALAELRHGIEGESYQDSGEVYTEGGLLADHIEKYLRDYGATITEWNVEDLEFEDDLSGGYVCVQ